MIRAAIIGYTVLHGFFYSCNTCMTDSRYWMPYYIADEIVGGGVILWWVAYKYSKDFKVPCFALFVFSIIRCLWNLSCWIWSINASNTEWTTILFFCLLPVVYYILFFPNSKISSFLDTHLKRLKL